MTVSTGMRNAHALGKKLLGTNNFDSGLCCFGTVGRGIAQRKIITSGACHAALTRMDRDTVYVPLKMVDVLYSTHLSKRQELMWYSFILERSVYSPIFAEREARIGHERGYFIYNTDINANLLVAGSIAIRQASEHSPIVKHFCGLVEAGTAEDIAFIVSHAMHSDLEGNVGVKKSSYNSHVPVYANYFSRKNLLRYFKSDMRDYPIYRTHCRYSGLNKMFGENASNADEGVIAEIYKFWTNRIKGEKYAKRAALFNISYNRPCNGIKSLPKEHGYPLLANILVKMFRYTSAKLKSCPCQALHLHLLIIIIFFSSFS